MTPDQKRIDKARERLAAAQAERETKPMKPWDVQRLAVRDSFRVDDLQAYVVQGFERIGGQLQELQARIDKRGFESDVIRIALRLDEVWYVLIRAGLLPVEAYHETLMDPSDQYGRIAECPHCADDIAKDATDG